MRVSSIPACVSSRAGSLRLSPASCDAASKLRVSMSSDPFARSDGGSYMLFSRLVPAGRVSTTQRWPCFWLALTENESYQNNATGCWTGIFLVGLNQTYSPLDVRLHLLSVRLEAAEPLQPDCSHWAAPEQFWLRRLSALAMEPIDGPWPAPTPAESRRARVRAWELLAARFADPETQVASSAKKLASEGLRGAIRSRIGDEAMAIIATHLMDFAPAERVHLREKLEEVTLYDATLLDPLSEYPARLEQLLAPNLFRERLRQQVGAWGPPGLRKGAGARDEVLVREGLTGDPPPLLGELDWLISAEARRAQQFAHAMGRCDDRGVPCSRRSARGRGVGRLL